MTNLAYNIKSTKWLLPILLVVSGLYISAAAFFGFFVNILVLGAILGLSVFYLSYSVPKYNPIILVSTVYLTPLLVRLFNLYELPYGIVSEALIVLMVFTLILNGRISGWKTVTGILLLVWLAWHFIEILNPAAPSRVASLLVVRKVAFSVAIFFIVYSSISSKKDIFLFLKGWLVLAFLTAMYGMYQEYVGLPFFDEAWVNSDETIFNLLFTWGRLRKFSFFFSPTEYGITMAYAGVACFIFLLTYANKLNLKVLLFALSVIFFWSMMFSGSRTASILLPIGFLVFGLLTMKRKVLITLGVIALLGTVAVLRPTSSASLYVMLTAFDSDDASMNVRLTNQKIIQAYVRDRPLGFGLGSTGASGRKYAAGSFISSFPPDSEYVRVAIETGWLGLLLWCTILAAVGVNAINTYFRIRDGDLLNFATLLIPLLIMIIVAQYPQEMLSGLYLAFILVVALIEVIRKLSAVEELPTQE